MINLLILIGLDLIGRVTCKQAYNVKGRKDGDNIVVMDFGIKRNIIKSLNNRGVNVG
jgi:carbamoylphosphate synthase small subunit